VRKAALETLYDASESLSRKRVEQVFEEVISEFSEESSK
jgi:hypothetical protein